MNLFAKDQRANWRNKLLLLLAALILVAAAGFAFLQREPSYEGKNLSEWFEENASNPPRQAEARQAIQQMGARAVPFLIREMKSEEPRWRTYYREKWQTFPAALKRYAPKPRPAPAHPIQAVDLLGAIGPPAAAAVPDLVAILHRKESNPSTAATSFAPFPNSFDIRWQAARALGEIHSRTDIAAPALAFYFLNNTGPVADQALQSFTRLEPKAKKFLPLLREYLNRDPDREISNAELVLRIDDQDPGSRAVLERLLTDKFDIYRLQTCEALGRLGPNATWARPQLNQALRDSNPEVSKAAANALKQIEGAGR